MKIAPHFYAPYRILQKIGEVAYFLELPLNSKIQPVFHVSCLKKVVGQKDIHLKNLPAFDDEGTLLLQPLKVLNQWNLQKKGSDCIQLLVHWTGLPIEDATWEDAHLLRECFSAFQPWGQGWF